MTRARRRRRRLAFLCGALLCAFAAGVAIGRADRAVPRASGQALTVRVAIPASRVTERTADAKAVPILMYHVLGDPPAGAAFPDLYVRPADFAGQMRWLEQHGFHAVTLDAVWKHWHGARTLPARPIVVSFDDGYRSDVGVALPVLKRDGWPGDLNLKVGNLKPGNLRPRGVRRLIAAGWEIDAHTITHPDLTTVGDQRLRYEVAGSRTAIRRLFHVPVDFFCYPAGRYDARVVAAVRRAGYFGATTTNFGLARPSQPYALDRVRVSSSDGVRGLASKLASLGP